MIFHLRNGVVGREDPVVERRLGPTGVFDRRYARSGGSLHGRCSRLFEEWQRRSEEHLARTQNQQFLSYPALGVVTNKFCGAKLAGRKIKCGKSHRVSGTRNAGEEVVLFRVEMSVHRRSRREHARDLALHQRLREPGILHLLANGDLEALANQLGNVVIGRVIGHAAHGNCSALFFVSRGQRDLQLA